MYENSINVDNIITTLDLFSESAEWWKNVLKGVDTLIHVAWYTEVGYYLHSSKNLDCLQGTINMAKGASEAGVRRLVGVGTCFEYDLSKGLCSIETPLKPLTIYASAKASAYNILSQWLPKQKVEFAWCRLFYLYGEGEDIQRLAPYLRSKLTKGEVAELSSGDKIRDFMDVRQAGILIASVALASASGPINICSGKPITIREFAENIADEYGRRDLLKFSTRKEEIFNPPMVVGKKNFIKI